MVLPEAAEVFKGMVGAGPGAFEPGPADVLSGIVGAGAGAALVSFPADVLSGIVGAGAGAALVSFPADVLSGIVGAGAGGLPEVGAGAVGDGGWEPGFGVVGVGPLTV